MPTKKGKIAGNRKHGHGQQFHCIVKRNKTGICEAYDERKVYGSAYAACYVVLMNEMQCEKIANSVARSVSAIVHAKREMESNDIAKHVMKELKKRNSHAAFMYETHRDIA